MNHSFNEDRTRILALSDCGVLSKILCDSSEETALRLLAAQQLGSLGDPGREALQAAYDTTAEDPPGRIAALKSLVTSFFAESKPTLLDALNDPWPRVRRSARLLLKTFFEALDVDFRLCCYLPKHLQTNKFALEGIWAELPSKDQITVLDAIGRARFSPALPRLVKALHTEKFYGPLSQAIRLFGNNGIPYLIHEISNLDKNQRPGSFLEVLDAINTPESRNALNMLPENSDLKQFKFAKKSYDEWVQSCIKTEQDIVTKYQTGSYYELSKSLDSAAFNLLFDRDRVRFRAAIEQLQRQGGKEVLVLFRQVANDDEMPRCYRQWAHDGAEVWRRYNGNWKR